MTGAARANVWSIPPSAAFLPTLADALLDGTLIDGWSLKDPLDLASVTIFLPTRRASRALVSVLHDRLGQSAILPSIRPLGDMEDDGAFLPAQLGANPLHLEPVMPAMQRRLLLAELILSWRRNMPVPQQTANDVPNPVPSSPADAAALAADLASLMDQVATEEISWDGLADLVPDSDEYREWWDATLKFLDIAISAWPNILAERGQMDPADHRRLVLDHQTTNLANRLASGGPVVAAGSTGSIPATARLLRAISLDSMGAVVLPGLDLNLGSAWYSIGRLGAQKSEPAHPQYGLKTLLSDDPADPNKSPRTARAVLPVARADVGHLVSDTPTDVQTARGKLISETMRPAASTELWSVADNFDPAMAKKGSEGISLVECRDMHSEALAIAAALRESLETQGRTAALVTPDRTLAPRVRAALRRFGIEADDSAGRDLFEFPQGSFLRLVLDWCLGTDSDKRLVLAALLKHPLCCLGYTQLEARSRARIFEIFALRGNPWKPEPGALVQFVEDALAKPKEDFAHPAYKRLEGHDFQEAIELAARLDAATAPLMEVCKAASCEIRDLLLTTASCLEAVAAQPDMPMGELYEDEAGRQLGAVMRSINEGGAASGLRVEAFEWPSLLRTLLSGVAVRPTRDSHRTISILGPLEARLLQFDLVILGSMNEGTWPSLGSNDPFLSRAMKIELGLEPPERRIGQAAHDVSMLMGMPEVMLTRSLRVDGVPTVASRWVQRLFAVLGKDYSAAMKARGKPYADFAENFDAPAAPPNPCHRPAPRPALDLRPKRFSFTEIEKLIRDPYAIYASRILGLKPFDPLILAPNHADQGTILHDVFAQWISGGGDPLASDALDQLHALARDHFEELNLPPETRAFWEPRFLQIAAAFLAWQPRYDGELSLSLVEQRGQLAIDDTHVISGRADRLDITKTGTIRVLDYKGNSPTLGHMRLLLAPQIPLEGAVALRGGFDGISGDELDDLYIVRLKPGYDFKAETASSKQFEPTPNELADEAWARLQKLVMHFADPDTPYLSLSRNRLNAFGGDYDHLARIDEWNGLSGEGDAVP
jgi:ATP-dependent helicase/nuclease subunit B